MSDIEIRLKPINPTPQYPSKEVEEYVEWLLNQPDIEPPSISDYRMSVDSGGRFIFNFKVFGGHMTSGEAYRFQERIKGFIDQQLNLVTNGY